MLSLRVLGDFVLYSRLNALLEDQRLQGLSFLVVGKSLGSETEQQFFFLQHFVVIGVIVAQIQSGKLILVRLDQIE